MEEGDSCHDQASAWLLGDVAERDKWSSVAGVRVMYLLFMLCMHHLSSGALGAPDIPDPGATGARVESCWEADRGCASVKDLGGNRGACRLQASGDSTGGRAFSSRLQALGDSTHCPVTRILEQIVEVIEVILQEQCQ